ncbi:MAG: hypothetical protein A2511_02340 [Deltaproteobacteria bacterium RIFOXYD12_FULL_50_9]|nr:MAG: hypothetical protein A2511_02340 [Deltaproteobacteria bacterium RIFOXYD12_FULL_50_9]
MRTQYRSVPLYKSPFDLVLYLQLISRLRPATVIEIGAKFGGSALWFADMLALHGISPRIVSVDIEDLPRPSDSRILFIHGDVLSLGVALPNELLKELPRPWLVVEDSAHYYHTCLAALTFFDACLEKGDYLVVEDGIVAELPQNIYGRYENGPNRAVNDFLSAHPERYKIDWELCDFYGRNITYNPNAWLCRT